MTSVSQRFIYEKAKEGKCVVHKSDVTRVPRFTPMINTKSTKKNRAVRVRRRLETATSQVCRPWLKFRQSGITATLSQASSAAMGPDRSTWALLLTCGPYAQRYLSNKVSETLQLGSKGGRRRILSRPHQVTSVHGTALFVSSSAPPRTCVARV